MQAEAFTWHYVVALGFFTALGLIGHVCRAIFNPHSDPFYSTTMRGRMISGRSDWSERLFGGDYDESGFYRLQSLRNLRNAILLSGFSGMAVMLASPGTAGALAQVIDSGLSGLGGLFLHRVEIASLF
ncbi:MAG: hypothetical protein ACOH2J_17340 [Allorhizobium sp.]